MIFVLTSCLIRPTVLEPAPQTLQNQLDSVDWVAVEKEATKRTWRHSLLQKQLHL